MPLHHAVLSLLAEGESYGYELRGAFERSVGPQWGRLNIGHLYQVLDRLRRDGHVEVVRAEPQPRRPDRLIYAITASGRDELDGWLEAASAPPAGYRDDLYLKLAAAARLGAERLQGVIRRERHALLAELHAVRATSAGDAFAGLLAEAAANQLESRLNLLDHAEAETRALVSAARAQRAEHRPDAHGAPAARSA